MTPMTIGNFSIARKSTQGKKMLRMMWPKRASRDGCFAATRSQFDLYTCFSITRINYKVHVVPDSQKSYILYSSSVQYLSLSLYIYHTQDVNTKTPT